MYASGPWFIYKWAVTLKLFVDPIFFQRYGESVFLYSGTVTREVKRGKRDFQDGARFSRWN